MTTDKLTYHQEYYIKNKERLNEYARQWHAKNKKTTVSYKRRSLEELEAKHGPRPNCCNPGCGKPAYGNGHRWTMFCSHCRLVSQGKAEPKPHIEYLRKNSCANYDGRADLGFPCFTNWKLVKKHKAKIATHMDHIDGNHLNNDAANLMELCPYCHDEKGRQNGDKNGWKNRKNTVKNA